MLNKMLKPQQTTTNKKGIISQLKSLKSNRISLKRQKRPTNSFYHNLIRLLSHKEEKISLLNITHKTKKKSPKLLKMTLWMERLIQIVPPKTLWLLWSKLLILKGTSCPLSQKVSPKMTKLSQATWTWMKMTRSKKRLEISKGNKMMLQKIQIMQKIWRILGAKPTKPPYLCRVGAKSCAFSILKQIQIIPWPKIKGTNQIRPSVLWGTAKWQLISRKNCMGSSLRESRSNTLDFPWTITSLSSLKMDISDLFNPPMNTPMMHKRDKMILKCTQTSRVLCQEVSKKYKSHLKRLVLFRKVQSKIWKKISLGQRTKEKILSN